MKRCESVRSLFSELIDGELGDTQVKAVEAHLGQCAMCRDEFQAIRQLDKQLAGVLVIDNVEEKIQQAFAAGNSTVGESDAATGAKFRRQIPSLGIIGAIAALWLVAFFVWSLSNPPPVSIYHVVAHLVSATGPVEVRAANAQHWRTVLPPERIEIQNGARVRTGNAALCEIQTTGQGKVRMDRGCEIILNDSHDLELVAGKLWCSAPSHDALKVTVPIQQSDQPVMAMLTCPNATVLQCDATPSSVSCSRPPGSESNEAAEIHVGEQTWQIKPGQIVVVASSQEMTRGPRADTADVWQLPLLALSSDSRLELSSYLQRLLAPVGRTKARHMNEAQIRALGPAGAIPLLSFVLHEPGADSTLRRTAMRLVTETADESSIPMLRQLTTDEDPFIASRAANLLDGFTNK